MVTFDFSPLNGGLGNTFVRKQPTLDVLTERETRQRTIRADNAVAGHEKADGVRGIGPAHCPRGARLAELRGEFAISPRFTKWNQLQRGPDALLKDRAARSERNRETLPALDEIFLNLAAYFGDASWIANEFARREALTKSGHSTESRGKHSAGRVNGYRKFADRSRKCIIELFHGGVGWLNCQRCAVARLR